MVADLVEMTSLLLLCKGSTEHHLFNLLRLNQTLIFRVLIFHYQAGYIKIVTRSSHNRIVRISCNITLRCWHPILAISVKVLRTVVVVNL